MERKETIETTLGELIATLTEEAAALIDDERDVHNTVAFMLTHLLNNRSAASRSERYRN